jgi:fucose permease
MLEITLDLMAATIFTKNTGTMLNLAHFFYGVGSAFGPLLSARLMAAAVGGAALGWRHMYLVILSWALIPLIPGLFGRFAARPESKPMAEMSAFLRDPAAWLVILILSFGGFCELGMGGWFVNFLEKAYKLDSGAAAMALTWFFVCFTLARLVLGSLTDKIGFVKSLGIFTGFSGAAIIAGVLCGESGVVLLVLSGAGMALVYPTALATVAKLFKAMIDTAMTATLTIMGIISMLSNLALGGVIETARRIFTGYYGDPGVGMAYSAGIIFLGLCCLAACAAAFFLHRILKGEGALV